MDDGAWEFDDPKVDDAAVVYRRIPDNPDFTYRASDGLLGLNPAALRRTDGEGMSVHLEAVLAESARADHAYTPPPPGIIGFAAGIPRTAGGGVVAVPDPQERDEVLARAHAEVRGPLKGDQGEARLKWKDVRAAVAEGFAWVRLPGAASGSLGTDRGPDR